MIVGVAIDRRALHVLHHEVGKALGRGAAVEEPRDVRMVQRGEDLPLVAEAADDQLRVHAAADHLDGDRVLEIAGAPGQIDRAHAAASDAALDHVGADLPADVRVVVFGVFERVERAATR